MTVEIDADVLADLDERVRKARRPERMLVVGQEEAGRLQFISDLIDYWAERFDWRAQERQLNRLPHFRATVGGIGVHFLWQRSARQPSLPLLLTNGWPSSFLEYADVLDAVGDGVDGGPAFDLVVPTIPGYGLSDHALDARIDEDAVAELWLELMTMLDYPVFYAHGDDFGGGIVSRLAWRHPDAVAAIHVSEWLEPAHAAELTAAEQTYLEALADWRELERAYGAIAATRPQTLGFALDDSPVGLLAWLADKYLSWSDPATVDAWSADRILTFVTLYWTTRAITPSLRLYANAPTPVPAQAVVAVPAAVVAPLEARPAPPREWLERTYADLRSYRQRELGGHFMAIEHPEGFVRELCEFFGQFAT